MSEKPQTTFASNIYNESGYSATVSAIWTELGRHAYTSTLHIVSDRNITDLTFTMAELELFAGELHRANDHLIEYKSLNDEEKHQRGFYPPKDRHKAYNPLAIYLKENPHTDPWVWIVPDTYFDRVELHIADHSGRRETKKIELSKGAIGFILAEISRLRHFHKQQGLETYIQALNLAELIDTGILTRHKNDVLTLNPKYELGKLLELAETGDSDNYDAEPDQDEE